MQLQQQPPLNVEPERGLVEDTTGNNKSFLLVWQDFPLDSGPEFFVDVVMVWFGFFCHKSEVEVEIQVMGT